MESSTFPRLVAPITLLNIEYPVPKTVSSTSTMEFSPIASQWPEGRRVERTTGIVSVDGMRES